MFVFRFVVLILLALQQQGFSNLKPDFSVLEILRAWWNVISE